MYKTYSELCELDTFEERFRYLKLDGSVGVDTFGFDRYMNQQFYRSKEWKDIRDYVIVRDGACDLGVEGFELRGKILIHHMNPISQIDIIRTTDILLNPEFLICTSMITHNGIHYGDESCLRDLSPVNRRPNDTCPWKK